MKHTGRHTGAFLLLFLAEGDSYGGKLLQRCEEELPINPIDSAIIYRTLQKIKKTKVLLNLIWTHLIKISQERCTKLLQWEKDN